MTGEDEVLVRVMPGVCLKSGRERLKGKLRGGFFDFTDVLYHAMSTPRFTRKGDIDCAFYLG